MDNLADLRSDKRLLAVRGFAQSLKKIFAPFPCLRDLFPERLAGVLYPVREGTFIVSTLGGQAIVVSPKVGGVVEKQLYAGGTYETGIVSLLGDLLRPGESMVDVGANIGAITIPAAARVGPTGHVYSFEPVSSTAAMLRKSLELNGFGWAEIFQMGLSESAGVLPIYADSKVNRGGVSLMSEGHAQKIEEVKLARLDETLSVEAWQKVTLLKIDVEGWELEALRGAQKLFESGHIPAMIVEYSADEHPEKALKLYEFLKSLPQTKPYRMRYTKRCAGPLCEIRTASDLPKADNIVLLPSKFASRARIV